MTDSNTWWGNCKRQQRKWNGNGNRNGNGNGRQGTFCTCPISRPTARGLSVRLPRAHFVACVSKIVSVLIMKNMDLSKVKMHAVCIISCNFMFFKQ